MNRGDESAYPNIQEAMDINARPGLTIRERFAMAMMQGYLSNCETWKEWTQEDMEKQAVIVADELVAELEKNDA